MFLSKIWIDWQWARDPYQIHRALWQLFPNSPDAKRDFLFRVEDLQPGRGAAILLQSVIAPERAEVASVIASKAIEWQLPAGALLRFKLRGNPVKTIKDKRQRLNRKGEVKACRVPLIHEEEQRQWLVRKLDGAARLETMQLVTEPPLYFRKAGVGGKVQPVSFEGILILDDPERLLALINEGIGPAKSLGCGLLSLGRA